MEHSLNPSQYHEYVLKSLQPKLAYHGQPFEQWQAELSRAFMQQFGWDPNRTREPLNVHELEFEDHPEYTRRKLVFTSEPYADVLCHLLIPKGVTKPVPAFICLQGHNTGMHLSIGQSKFPGDEEYFETDYDFAVQAARQGYVALAVEQRAFGERSEALQEMRAQNGCEDAVLHALLLGRPFACERAWDVSRAIDLLETIPEVRQDRVCCMGSSGGGTVTFYAACVDTRIWLAMCACSFCTYADSIFRIAHCPDNYIPGILTLAEVSDLTGLIAPRRLLIVNGQDDPIFPIAGVRCAFESAQRVFQAAGAADNVELVIGEGGHRFYAAPSWPIVQRWLQTQ